MPRNRRNKNRGREGRGGGGGGRGGSRGGGGHARGTERTNKAEVIRENEKYQRYYDSLNLVPEDEKEAFWAAMRRDLPNSFRFTGSRGHALAVQERLKDFYIPEIVSIKHEGEFVEAPKPVIWYPDQLAWYMTVPKNVIRRFAPFANFQKFLVAENDVGSISRQEVVSMIPPLLMDIKPGMTVLDLCAAPGSKSAQLLEMVLAGEEERTAAAAKAVEDGETDGTSYEDDGRATGLLVANDVDYKRAHMLTHQLKRLSSANLIITNHDATMYPSIKLPSDPHPDGKPTPNKYLKFDRILADVPCSGDGTSRKNLEIWKNWAPQSGIGLHITQVRILVRALQMLKAGGRVVYSTCSMSPIEDEAVLLAAIDRCGGPEKIRLVDCSNELPGLKRYPGIRNWTVMDRNGDSWNNWADVESARQMNDRAAINNLSETMFPPKDPAASKIPIEYAMRVYPHSQDTGAFFIAVLEKVSEIRARPEKDSKKAPEARVNGSPETGAENGESVAEVPAASSTLKRKIEDQVDEEAPEKKTKAASEIHPLPTKPPVAEMEVDENVEPKDESLQHPLPVKPPTGTQKKRDQPFEEPFKYLSPDIPELQQIRNFYSISGRFPMDRFMVRNPQGTATKNIYYTTGLARDILTSNEGKGMKFIHSGVKMFVKQDVPNPEVCPWRIQTDGLVLMERWVGKDRVVTLRKKETLRKLLIEMFPKFSGDSWQELGEIGQQVLDVNLGCCVLRIEPGQGDDDLKEYMVFPLWKSVHSLNLMLPKEDRRAMLLRLFNDSTPVVNPMKGAPSKGSDEMKKEEVVVEEGAHEGAGIDNTSSEEDGPGAP